MEHRWGDRIDCNVAVKLLADPASIGWGKIRNVSASGAYIETLLPVRTLSMLSLRRASDREPGRYGNLIRAIVVRRDENGVGIEWTESESKEVAAIIQEAALYGPFGPLVPQSRSPRGDVSAST
jgi:hypothetical protein